ncbi:MAG: ATP-binding cassette domain-containing protein [Leptospiraceae bacterium]|nr:ATP-binding cassette domain-containing protein [Leptospiraceae bacterium]
MLAIENGAVGYGRRVLITGINVAIAPKDVIFLSGANGSGKSTLAKTLLGVLPLLAGSRHSTFQNLAYVPQQTQFTVHYPFTVADLVLQGLPPLWPWAPRPKRQEQMQRALAILQHLGLEQKSGLLLRELSGGELQRALIARALVTEPDFLLLDEPFSNLDRSGRSGVAEILKRYAQKGGTILVVDHSDAIDKTFYRRFWEIDNGTLRELC